MNDVLTDARKRREACPLCDKKSFRILVKVSAQQIVESSPFYNEASYKRLRVSPSSLFGVSQCDACGFVFSSDIPSDEFLERLYGESGNIKKSVEVFARPQRAAYAFRALSILLSALAKQETISKTGVISDKLKILDVGCAFGVGSLGLAQNFYPYDISGVEWSDSTRNYLSDQGMTVYRSLDDIRKGTQFDGILLNDILEHIPDPLQFISKIHALSHANTFVWVNVPNFIDWRLRDVVKTASSGSMDVPKDFNPWEHLSYFSPKSLTALMLEAGFNRWSQMPLEYPIQYDSSTNLMKMWIRSIRDIWRIYRKKYPSEFSTAALFKQRDDSV